MAIKFLITKQISFIQFDKKKVKVKKTHTSPLPELSCFIKGTKNIESQPLAVFTSLMSNRFQSLVQVLHLKMITKQWIENKNT